MKKPIVVEIVRPTGKVVRVVERTSFGRSGLGSGHATWSPNGRMLAWFDAEGLNVENSDGSNRREIVAFTTARLDQAVSMSYAWSPDSRTIAVGGAGTQTNRLIEIDVGTGKQRNIAPVQRWTEYSVIGFSPDGRKLAFMETSGHVGYCVRCRSWLVVSHADGRKPRKLFAFADPFHDGAQDATWSPDSASLAFTEDGKDIHDPTLAIVNVATGIVKPFTIAPADTPPIWSPDGTKLALVKVVSGTSYSINTFTISDRTLAQVGTGDLPVSWNAAGSIVTVGNDNASLRAIDTTTTSERTLFALPKPYQFMSVNLRAEKLRSGVIAEHRRSRLLRHPPGAAFGTGV